MAAFRGDISFRYLKQFFLVGTKFGRNFHWMVLYKVYVFFRSDILHRKKGHNGTNQGVSIYLGINDLFCLPFSERRHIVLLRILLHLFPLAFLLIEPFSNFFVLRHSAFIFYMCIYILGHGRVSPKKMRSL
jgi:hypothetical protein